MMRNRRNYYRILHVQPEAPLEIIRASYRALMGPLGLHPDRGGDHAMAVLINEAYAVLSDPDRRAAYDRTLQRGRGRAAETSAAAAAASVARASAPARGASADPGPDPRRWQLDRCCPFCATRLPGTPRVALPGTPRVASRCARCAAPIAPIAAPGPRRKELFGSRTSARISKTHEATMIVAPGSAPLAVRMRDLSLTGLSVHSPVRVEIHRAVHVIDAALEGVAVIVACRRRDAAYTLHAQLLTLQLREGAGVFVSARA